MTMSNVSKYQNLICVVENSPDDLIKALRALPVPSSVVTGSWFTRGMQHGCYVLLDRPAEIVRGNEINKTKSRANKNNE